MRDDIRSAVRMRCQTRQHVCATTKTIVFTVRCWRMFRLFVLFGIVHIRGEQHGRRHKLVATELRIRDIDGRVSQKQDDDKTRETAAEKLVQGFGGRTFHRTHLYHSARKGVKALAPPVRAGSRDASPYRTLATISETLKNRWKSSTGDGSKPNFS